MLISHIWKASLFYQIEVNVALNKYNKFTYSKHIIPAEKQVKYRCDSY